jgi:hypothetical protein
VNVLGYQLDDRLEAGIEDRPPGLGPRRVNRAVGQPPLDPLSRGIQKRRVAAQSLGDLAVKCKAALDFRSYAWWVHDGPMIQTRRVDPA